MLIATLNKGTKTEIRVNLNPAQALVDLRVFERYTAAGLYTVTKAGLAISVSDIDALIAALTEAKAASKSGGGND